MENDYILRKDAIAELIKLQTVMPQFGGDMVERARAVKAIRSILAAEVAPVRDGHWDSSHDGHRWVLVCSECGAWDYDEGGYKPHFCHSCGAKMKMNEEVEQR